jgi:SulP family sulfate permease
LLCLPPIPTPTSPEGSLPPLKGDIHSIWTLSSGSGVVAVLLFAGPLRADFPPAALGAIVVYAATRLIGLAKLPPASRHETLPTQ